MLEASNIGTWRWFPNFQAVWYVRGSFQTLHIAMFPNLNQESDPANSDQMCSPVLVLDYLQNFKTL